MHEGCEVVCKNAYRKSSYFVCLQSLSDEYHCLIGGLADWHFLFLLLLGILLAGQEPHTKLGHKVLQ